MLEMANTFDELKSTGDEQLEKLRWLMSAEERKSTHGRIDAFVAKALRRCQRRRKNQPFGRLQNQPLKSMKPHARRSPGMGLCYSGLGLFGLARPALGETV